MTFFEKKNSGRKEHGIYWKYLFCAVVTAILVISLAALYFKINVNVNFLSNTACQQVKAAPFSKEYTFCFYGSEWDEGTYLSSITSFYSTLITVLIAAQSLVSALAFVVIKASNKRIVEEEVESELPKYFNTVAAVNQVREFVNDSTKSALSDQLGDVKNLISGLQGDVEELRARVYELEGNGDADDQESNDEGIDPGTIR